MNTPAIPKPERQGGFWSSLRALAFLNALLCTACGLGATAQASDVTSANAFSTNSSSITNLAPNLDQQARAFERATERIRSESIQGRRLICGKIIKILPEGLVVESGFTNLMRAPLNKSWLIPGTAQANREPGLLEANEPGCVCVGLVFLTDVPKSRTAAPKLFDYVLIQGYPAGHYTYNSVGTVQRTVRHFSANLAAAVRANRASAGLRPPDYGQKN